MQFVTEYNFNYIDILKVNVLVSVGVFLIDFKLSSNLHKICVFLFCGNIYTYLECVNKGEPIEGAA